MIRLDRVFGLQRIEIDHAAARYGCHGDQVDHENDLFLRKPHHQRRIRVVEADVLQLELSAAEHDGAAFVADRLVWHDGMRILQHGKALFGALVRDHPRAGVLERLAAGNVVVVMVTVDEILDRLVRDLLDLVDVGLPARRTPVGNWIGRDHARLGDDEHGLVVAVAEDVDVVRALHFCRGKGRWRWRLRQTWADVDGGNSGYGCGEGCSHEHWTSRGVFETSRTG